MKIEYYHASKYGNGARVAEEFQKRMGAKGVTVNVHPIREARPKEMPPFDADPCDGLFPQREAVSGQGA